MYKHVHCVCIHMYACIQARSCHEVASSIALYLIHGGRLSLLSSELSYTANPASSGIPSPSPVHWDCKWLPCSPDIYLGAADGLQHSHLHSKHFNLLSHLLSSFKDLFLYVCMCACVCMLMRGCVYICMPRVQVPAEA